MVSSALFLVPAARLGSNIAGRMNGATPNAERPSVQVAGHVSLRRLAKVRPWVTFALLLMPLLTVLSVDVARRGSRLVALSGFYRMTYVASVLESFLVWGTLLYAASRRRGALSGFFAGLFVIGLTLSVGGQRYFHDQYNAYLNVDVSLFATNLMESVFNQLFADIRNYLLALLAPFSVAVLALVFARRIVRPRRRERIVAQILAPVFVFASFFIPTQHRFAQAATPDILYLEGVGGLIRTQLGLTDQSRQLRPTVRHSLPVVLALPKKTGQRPNVLFVILESVRADAVCVEPEKNCQRTPFSDRVVPDRFPLPQMLSLDSTTAVSLAVLWSGVGPTEPREVLHTWPLLFDYAKAEGYDTAFWTSQNMMFGNARLWVKNLGVSEFASATDFDPASDLDMGAPEGLLADHVDAHLSDLKEPFLAVVQFSNMHYPYLVNTRGSMPFQPWTTSKAADENTHFYNYYLNGVHQQDEHVAKILERVKSSALADHTIIVYTSDHAEAFRDHGQMGHTFSVLDEEIHVPAWIDVPKGLVSADQERALTEARHSYVFHPDLTATILDVMGAWDDPGIAKYRSKMLGRSLLRPLVTDPPMPLTNCAGVWSCAFENWGYMRKSLKLEARAWDPEWHCYDLSSDPYESHNLGREACGDLGPLALSAFHRLPGGEHR
jgi:glucan phosphoethanolaminetransferase (alkaline phosphatase superfamily)